MDTFLRKALTYVLVLILLVVAILKVGPRELNGIDVSISTIIFILLAMEAARQFKKFLHFKKRKRENMA
jgi:heme/copper-type cytochrome/quinol oxidase subunit 4